MLGIVGIIISLLLLMYLAYRGINVLVLAPIMALLAVVLGGGFETLLPTYTQIFMKELGGYLIKFFPLFLLGAIFGKLMDDSGSARSIAQWIVARLGKQRAILAIVLSCGILTYGAVLRYQHFRRTGLGHHRRPHHADRGHPVAASPRQTHHGGR